MRRADRYREEAAAESGAARSAHILEVRKVATDLEMIADVGIVNVYEDTDTIKAAIHHLGDYIQSMENQRDQACDGAWLPAGSVVDLRKRMASGWIPQVGEIALIKNGVVWRCVHHWDEDWPSMVLMMVQVYDFMQFSQADKKNAWGSNCYETSSIRKKLNGRILDELFGEEKVLLGEWSPAGIGSKLFLLSTGEAGYERDERAFDWFHGYGENLENAHRSLTDRDGDPCKWWLRSGVQGEGSLERCVYTDGKMDSAYSSTACGVVAACYIEAT